MATPREPQLPLLTVDPRERGRGLLAVCRLVVRSLERARRLSDDRPELALATLERWLEGDDGPAELHEAMELMVQATFDDRVTELASLARLPTALLDRHPDALSGGQRQRVALMRALVLDPEVLLLDEPLGALDPMVRAELQRDLRDAFRSLAKTVVLVTHDLREARHFGDTIVLLRDGRVVQQGTFAELESEPADPFVRDFFRAQSDAAVAP